MTDRPLIPTVWDTNPTGQVKGDFSQPKVNEYKFITIDGGGFGPTGGQRRALYEERFCDGCDTDVCTCYSYMEGAYAQRLLRMWNIEPRRLDNVAREFYGYLALQMSTGLDPLPDFMSTTAHNLYRAIALACAGEARYDVPLATSGIWGARVKKRGSAILPLPMYNTPHFKYYSKFGEETPSRGDIADNLLDFVDPYDIKFVRFLRNMFLWSGRYSRGVSGGYGGFMWAACAQIILDWRAGKLSDVEFIDRAFNSRHNGAPVLTKVFAYSGGGFQTYLNARSEASLEWIIRWTPNWMREAFGLERCMPLASYRSRLMGYSLDGKTLAVLPDNVREIPEGSLATYPDSTEKGSETFIGPLLSKIRDDHAFFTYGKKCRCQHGCVGVNIEHDCEKVCKDSCTCRARMAEIKFTSRKKHDGYDTHDPEGGFDEDDGDEDYDNNYSECSECGSSYHDSDDCPYCEWCDHYGHESNECYNYHTCSFCTQPGGMMVHNCNTCVELHEQEKGHQSHISVF